jgi:hypothetical protein
MTTLQALAHSAYAAIERGLNDWPPRIRQLSR